MPEPGTELGIGGGVADGALPSPISAPEPISNCCWRCASLSRLDNRYDLVDDVEDVWYLDTVGGGMGLAPESLMRLGELVYE